MRHWTKRRHSYGARPIRRVDTGRPSHDTVQVASRDLKRLADAVIKRRAELRLSREAFAERGGEGPNALSMKTLQRIEQQKAAPRAATLGALDRAAGWPSGRSRAILEGDSVAVSPEPTPERVDPAAATWGDLRRELKWWHTRLRDTPEHYERLLYLLDLSAQLESRAASTQGGVQLDAHG